MTVVRQFNNFTAAPLTTENIQFSGGGFAGVYLTVTDLILTSSASWLVNFSSGELELDVTPSAPLILTGMTNGPQLYLASYGGGAGGQFTIEWSMPQYPPPFNGNYLAGGSSSPQVNFYIAGTTP